MFRRYSFFIVIIAIFSGLTYWSDHVEHSYVGSQNLGAAQPVGFGRNFGLGKLELESPVRKELFEALDRIVAYEHYYRSIYGNFTQVLHRTGVGIPKSVAESYEIHVAAASKHRLLVTAFSEQEGRVVDLISINQDYEVISELPVPTPRVEYLQARAQKHIRNMNLASGGVLPPESGLFRGFFRFETRMSSSGQASSYAIGIKPPVEGIQIENEAISGSQNSMRGKIDGSADMFISELLPEIFSKENEADQDNNSGPHMSTQEEARLAQKIFYGEMGRYAENRGELSKITQFSFDGMEQTDKKGGTRTAHLNKTAREPASKNADSKRARANLPTAVSGELEIEPINQDP